MTKDEKLPRFSTERLLLREVKLTDRYSYKRNFVDYDVIRTLSNAVPWPYPENGVEDFLGNVIIPNQGKDRWMWGIFLKTKPDELIGCVELWRQGRPEHRGFWLAKKYWGQGLMTEAVCPINEYAFDNLRFEKLVFANAVGNIGSRRVKEKTGARFIKTVEAKFVDPNLTHQELWELSKKDWEMQNVLKES